MAGSWTPEATADLVAVWSQENVQNQLDGVSRNRTIFEKIAKEMSEKGYNKSWQQCRTKIKNLTQKYRKTKDKNRVTGETVHKCQFYESLDAILGTRAASCPSTLLESSDSRVERQEQNSASNATTEQDSTTTEQNSTTTEQNSTTTEQNSTTEENSTTTEQNSTTEQDGTSNAPNGTSPAITSTGALDSSGSSSCSSGGEEISTVTAAKDKSTAPKNKVAAPKDKNTTDKEKKTRGVKRSVKEAESNAELSTVLTKFIEVSEESERKRQALEADYRERERKHEERMLMMMMGIMKQLSGPTQHGLSTYPIHSTPSTYQPHPYDFSPGHSPYASSDFTPSPGSQSAYGSQQ